MEITSDGILILAISVIFLFIFLLSRRSVIDTKFNTVNINQKNTYIGPDFLLRFDALPAEFTQESSITVRNFQCIFDTPNSVYMYFPDIRPRCFIEHNNRLIPYHLKLGKELSEYVYVSEIGIPPKTYLKIQMFTVNNKIQVIFPKNPDWSFDVCFEPIPHAK